MNEGLKVKKRYVVFLAHLQVISLRIREPKSRYPNIFSRTSSGNLEMKQLTILHGL